MCAIRKTHTRAHAHTRMRLKIGEEQRRLAALPCESERKGERDESDADERRATVSF